MSGIYGPTGATTGIGLFTGAQVAAIRYYCGYGSYATYGYVLGGGGMATLDTQMASMVATEVAQVTALLTLLPTLDTAIQGASANLDTDQAAVWVHNKDEVRDRSALFAQYRLRLCELFNVPPGPGLRSRVGVVRT
ncbi:MAG: hypothetical protein KGL35_06725 [Bradyrhizobium sp.]|nr:hypothetical protein [Bradyrhizobium sp.]